MAVTGSVSESFVISGIKVDMGTPALNVIFTRTVDSDVVGSAEMRLEGDPFNAVFGVPGDSNKVRAQDLSDVLYQKAIDLGVIRGQMS